MYFALSDQIRSDALVEFKVQKELWLINSLNSRGSKHVTFFDVGWNEMIFSKTKKLFSITKSFFFYCKLFWRKFIEVMFFICGLQFALGATTKIFSKCSLPNPKIHEANSKSKYLMIKIHLIFLCLVQWHFNSFLTKIWSRHLPTPRANSKIKTNNYRIIQSALLQN